MRYIVGLDIGSSKVCASLAKINDKGKISIIGTTISSCGGVKKGVVVDIDMTVEAIEKCIFNLEKLVQFKINEAYISVQSGICDFYNNKGIVAIENVNKKITHSDVDKAIEASKLISMDREKEIIGVIIDRFILDGVHNVKDPIGMTGSKLEVEARIILIQKLVLKNLIISVNKAGLKILGITLESMALSSSVLCKEEKEQGVVVIDVGFDTINLSIFKNKKFCKSIFIPLGGNNLTKDLSLCLNISYEEAEELKNKYGALLKEKVEDEHISLNTLIKENNEISSYEVIDIINARVDETLRIIKEHIEESQYYDEIHNIVLVGGGFSFLKDIIQFSEEILEKPVRIGMPQYKETMNTLYATSLGIIMDVVENIKIEEESFDSKIEIGEEDKEIAFNNNDYIDKKETNSDEDNNYRKDNDENLGIIGKIKGFFAGIF